MMHLLYGRGNSRWQSQWKATFHALVPWVGQMRVTLNPTGFKASLSWNVFSESHTLSLVKYSIIIPIWCTAILFSPLTLVTVPLPNCHFMLWLQSELQYQIISVWTNWGSWWKECKVEVLFTLWWLLTIISDTSGFYGLYKNVRHSNSLWCKSMRYL